MRDMKYFRLPFAAALAACAFAQASEALAAPKGGGMRGAASWYGPGFHGRKTASGERFDSLDMTAAHRSLPFGTRLRVVNEKNGRSVVVRVNDRGPFAHRRIIDLAKGPAQALGLTSSGTAYVSLHRLN